MSYVCAIGVMVLAAYHILREIFWMAFQFRAYVYNIQNYIQWGLYTTSVIFVVFVFINHCGCPRNWQWQVGIVSVFLGWLNLIFLASNFPVISIYVIMFRDIFNTFFKLVFFALLLVSANSLVLFMMFHNPTATAKVTQ